MNDYLRRVVDDELDELLSELPAIVLEGPKGVGKTETARRRAQTTFELDEPAHSGAGRIVSVPCARLRSPSGVWTRPASVWPAC